MDDEDIRAVELETLSAIYPELQVDEEDPYRVVIDLPVSLSTPLVVHFPAPSGAAPALGPADHGEVDSQSLSHLPSLRVSVALPQGYPHEKPPTVDISTSPPWLSQDILRRLEGDAQRLWDDIGRDQVVYTYLDDLQQSTDHVFGLVDEKRTLEVGPEFKIAILDYDNNAKRKAFEKETFSCGICLDPKKGSVCHRMLDCGHVFCVECLKDFYNNAITEGDVAAVQCLEPSCAKEREVSARKAALGKRRKFRAFLSPGELLQIPLEEDMVRRYVAIKHKTELESDKNTVYCPRSWCQGAARSKKHKKPEGLEFAEASDEESDVEDAPAASKAKGMLNPSEEDLLAICEDCSFAFCSRCGQSWHGEFKYCKPKERKDEITEEEKATLEYLKAHSTPCPTCAAPCQKSQGCNHMRCFRCQSHFCYLCSAWLDPDNPYRHFNTQSDGRVNGCYMRLWELEGGDGDDVGIGYGGGNALENEGLEPGQYGDHLDILDDDGDDEDGGQPAQEIEEERPADGLPAEPLPAQLAQNGQRDAQPQQRPPNGGVAVAREAPLVLRIDGGAAPAARREERNGARPAQPQAGAVQAPNPGGGQRGRGGRRRGRGQAAANRQNNNRDQQRPQNAQARRNEAVDEGEALGNILRQQGELDHRQQAWIRHFVQLAMDDQEDLLGGASDDEL